MTLLFTSKKTKEALHTYTILAVDILNLKVGNNKSNVLIKRFSVELGIEIHCFAYS